MKRLIYVPQYTHTARHQGYPLHPPPEELNHVDVNNTQADPFQTVDNTAWTSPLIPVETSSIPIGSILLIIFGGLVLLAAVAAIVFSTVLNVGSKFSNSTTINTTTTVATTTVAATATTTTVYYSCQNLNVTINWNYPNNDIASVSPMTFPTCCLWCLSQSTCTAFVLTNATSTCYIKTSNGGGGGASAGTIGASL